MDGLDMTVEPWAGIRALARCELVQKTSLKNLLAVVTLEITRRRVLKESMTSGRRRRR